MVVQDALTVYHAVWDPQTRAGGWERRVIRGVCWQGGRADRRHLPAERCAPGTTV